MQCNDTHACIHEMQVTGDDNNDEFVSKVDNDKSGMKHNSP